MSVSNSMKTLAIAVLAATALAGCGKGDDDDDGFQVKDSTGSGSETLQVTASVELVGNGSADTEELEPTVTIAVKDQGSVPASEAVVTLQFESGSIELVENPAGTGIFTIASGDELPWSPAYGLTVARGSDVVEDVVIASPDLHEVTNPARFDNHFAEQPLDVEWTGADTADEYRIELESNPDPQTAWQDGDPGSFRIEGSYFAAGNGAYTEVLTVRRKKTLGLTGTLPASKLVLEIRQEVDPIAINPPQGQ